MSEETSMIGSILHEDGQGLLEDWLDQLERVGMRRQELIEEGELRQQCRDVLALLREAIPPETSREELRSFDATSSLEARELLDEISHQRVRVGVPPRENALFVFTLKRPLFRRLFHAVEGDAEELIEEIWTANHVVDQLGLLVIESYQRSREGVISRQQEELLELSTPVVRLWDGIVAMPLIGTLDSSRTQVVMETLLEKIVETGADTAILDITGVSTVDTLVAQHLLKTVAAARLMGADCIISGIRPQIAQTIVQLGLDLSSVTTKATLADAFGFALARRRGRNEASEAADELDMDL
ncbi:MAG TPA: STAS domain-containing protein [Thermoanaerobaculia bacterium]|nr:STAS domain-containing protein [Thermoanaerobaculia bacterium]